MHSIFFAWPTNQGDKIRITTPISLRVNEEVFGKASKQIMRNRIYDIIELGVENEKANRVLPSGIITAGFVKELDSKERENE